MHLLKRVTLSIVLLCLIISPVTHAYDLSSAWQKPENREWVIRGAALCAVLLAMIAYYSFFAHKPKDMPSSSTPVESAGNASVMQTQDLVIHMKVEPSDSDQNKQVGSKLTSVEYESDMQNIAKRRQLMICGHLYGSYVSTLDQRMKYLDGMSGGIEDEEGDDNEAWEGTLKCKRVENEIARLESGQLISAL